MDNFKKICLCNRAVKRTYFFDKNYLPARKVIPQGTLGNHQVQILKKQDSFARTIGRKIR